MSGDARVRREGGSVTAEKIAREMRANVPRPMDPDESHHYVPATLVAKWANWIERREAEIAEVRREMACRDSLPQNVRHLNEAIDRWHARLRSGGKAAE
jgi:hypothetical protein